MLIIAGAGQAFCAGHDLKEICIQNFGRAYTVELVSECAEVMLAIERLPKPVIARVHGVATAAGCQLVATCDLAFAAEEARFATPGVNIGLFCSTPMVALSRNVSRNCHPDAAFRRAHRCGDRFAHRAHQRGGFRVQTCDVYRGVRAPGRGQIAAHFGDGQGSVTGRPNCRPAAYAYTGEAMSAIWKRKTRRKASGLSSRNAILCGRALKGCA